MRLKSFFANSIEEAIRLARHELGPDAMLVNSKRTGAEARHLGSYEVVVCAESQQTGLQNPQHSNEDGDPGRSGFRAVASTLPVDKLSQDVSELKQRMEKLALTLARSGNGMASIAFDPELSRAFTTLTDAELDTEIAYDIVGRLPSPIPTGALRAELAKLVRVDSELGSRAAPTRVVALVGPPGAGKTSALVKLAVQYGLSSRKRVQVLTTDTYRIAAAEELRSYAAILGIGCQVLETPEALAHALAECCPPAECCKKQEPDQQFGDRPPKDENRQKNLILVDTPVCAVSRWKHPRIWREFWLRIRVSKPIWCSRPPCGLPTSDAFPSSTASFNPPNYCSLVWTKQKRSAPY